MPKLPFYQTGTPLKSGEIVKTLKEIYGVVVPYDPSRHPTEPKSPGKDAPFPGGGMNEKVTVSKGQIGEVLYSDEIHTVVIFPFRNTGRLQPQMVKAEGFTHEFQPVLRDPTAPSKHPFIGPEPMGGVRGELRVNPLDPMEQAAIGPTIQRMASNDPLEWGEGQGPHAQLLDAQEDKWWEQPEQMQKLAVMNALKVAILSPMKLLKHNAMHYQHFADIDPHESDLNVYLNRKKDLSRRWNMPGQNDLFGEQSVDPYEQEKGEYSEKYPGLINKHLEAIAKLSQYVDQLHSAAVNDLRSGGKGFIWRDMVRKLNVPQVNDKVASFAWLLLAPKTSELATIDVHIAHALGVRQPKGGHDYETYEKMLGSTKDAMGYQNMPLGAFQWGIWDYIRTGPGSHQLHDAMKPLNYTPYHQVKWEEGVGRSNRIFPPGFKEHEPVRDQILNQAGLAQNKIKDNRVHEDQHTLFSKWKRASKWHKVKSLKNV